MSNPFGTPHRHFPVAISVDALALAWARQDDAVEGSVVTADQELSARGRRGPRWVSVPDRSLAAAVVLRPAIPVEAEGLLWILASVAAADGLAQVTGLDVRAEWPNEILVGDEVIGIVKAAAQLGPGSIEVGVISLRVNTGLQVEDLPAPLRNAKITSLRLQGLTIADADLLAAFLERLEHFYAGGSESLLAAYLARCATIGQSVTATLIRRGDVSGTAIDVDTHGRLMLATPQGNGAVGIDLLERLKRG